MLKDERIKRGEHRLTFIADVRGAAIEGAKACAPIHEVDAVAKTTKSVHLEKVAIVYKI